MLLMVNNNGFNSRLNSAWTRKEACITSACVTGKWLFFSKSSQYKLWTTTKFISVLFFAIYFGLVKGHHQVVKSTQRKYFLDTEGKGSLQLLQRANWFVYLYYEDVSNLLFYFEIHWFTWNTKKEKPQEENNVLHCTSPLSVKIEKQTLCKLYPTTLIWILKNFPFTPEVLANNFNILIDYIFLYL